MSDLSSFATILAKAGLPTLATILSDAAPFPFNLFIASTLASIESALGIDISNPQQISTAAKDPDLGKKLAALEQVQSKSVNEATAELEVRLKDIENARSAQIAYVKANSAQQWGPPMVSAIVCLAFGVICWALIFRQVPDNGPANILLGTLSAGFSAVVAFWLGSSQGSRAKDEILGNLAGNGKSQRK